MRVFTTSDELREFAEEGSYVYQRAMPVLGRGKRVLAYQTAFNMRILVMFDADRRVTKVIPGGT